MEQPYSEKFSKHPGPSGFAHGNPNAPAPKITPDTLRQEDAPLPDLAQHGDGFSIIEVVPVDEISDAGFAEYGTGVPPQRVC